MTNDGKIDDVTGAEIMMELLLEADPGNLYLPALSVYPYMMTPDQISEFTGLSSQGIRKMLVRGDLHGTQLGNRWLVPKLSLLRFLQTGCNYVAHSKEAQDATVEMR